MDFNQLVTNWIAFAEWTLKTEHETQETHMEISKKIASKHKKWAHCIMR